MTLGERLIQQGMKQGVDRGEKDFLVRLLEKKFQKIPPQYLAKVESANGDLLLNWGNKMFQASTIIEVFET